MKKRKIEHGTLIRCQKVWNRNYEHHLHVRLFTIHSHGSFAFFIILHPFFRVYHMWACDATSTQPSSLLSRKILSYFIRSGNHFLSIPIQKMENFCFNSCLAECQKLEIYFEKLLNYLTMTLNWRMHAIDFPKWYKLTSVSILSLDTFFVWPFCKMIN
jgi:hypothetical protein